MRVYLDNNIFVGIEDGDYELSSFKSARDIMFFYSAAHIDELIEGEQIPQLSVKERISIIEEIAGSNHILNGLQDPEFFNMPAKDMFELSKSPLRTIVRNRINKLSTDFNPDRDRFLEIIKLNNDSLKI